MNLKSLKNKPTYRFKLWLTETNLVNHVLHTQTIVNWQSKFAEICGEKFLEVESKMRQSTWFK